MKRRMLEILVTVMLLVVPLGPVYGYEAMRGHTGVVLYDEQNALNVYTLLAGAGETISYLIGLRGGIVHEWRLADIIPLEVNTDPDYTAGPQVETLAALRPGLHDRLLTNGNLLRGYRPDTYDAQGKINIFPASGQGGGVLEFTWDGQLVWWYTMKTRTEIQHHSFYRVEQPSAQHGNEVLGNTFILGWELIDEATALAAGRDPTTVGSEGIWPDFIREVNQAGDTVWEWRTWDHVGPGPNEFDINAQTIPVNESDRDWTHGNSVEYNPQTGYVAISFRNWGEFFLIDHDGTFVPNDPAQSIANAAGPGGEIKFRWGNPGNYGAGTLPSFNTDGDQRIFGQHCVVFLGIDDTNPGNPENILIFDNGWHRPRGNRSRSVEIGPVDMVNWESTPIVWTYRSINSSSLYTAFQGGTQRLYEDATTGEKWTFLTSSAEGQLIQVYTNSSRQNQVVWDFVMPAIDSATDTRRCYHDDGVNNSIHRAHQYLPTYPGLVGKTLQPTGNIAGDCSQFYDLWDTSVVAGSGEEPPPLTGWGFGGTGIGGGGSGGGTGAGGGGGGY